MRSLKLQQDHETLMWLNAAAIKALEVGDDPVGLFIALAKDIAAGDTSKLEAYYDRAKLRMRDAIPGASFAESNGVDHAEET